MYTVFPSGNEIQTVFFSNDNDVLIMTLNFVSNVSQNWSFGCVTLNLLEFQVKRTSSQGISSLVHITFDKISFFKRSGVTGNSFLTL